MLGMGDGSMTTLTIADPEKEGIRDYLKSLPSRNPEGAGANGGGKIFIHFGGNEVKGPPPVFCLLF